ncbi:MAG: bifunctional (p)ppGpp synthetase/guanosine-3',5'-bis(diphosphate) 3'-pyrophosphohydrolase [Acidobacteria bacterium]|nr:bifunctional (p)ppGpp synthetase/guanosine-3',5'-bis(diphosphate) 3'-pyrophosphohydrolase [Acidobacteriota bacterium]
MNDLLKVTKAAVFAAKKHKRQTRKGANAEPYIIHPLEVANMLIEIGGVTDTDIIAAAIMHDTIEDTETTSEELTSLFGKNVCEYVLEVTDDKSLPKDERKLKQIEHAPHLSPGAKQIKLADKISNIRDVSDNPPENWAIDRRIEYIEWGEKVFEGLRGVNPPLEEMFEDLVKLAKGKIRSE